MARGFLVFPWAFLLLTALLPLEGQQKGDAAGGKGSWECALTVFTGGLTGDEEYLLRHFPLLLYHRIVSFEHHRLSEEEARERNRSARDKERSDLLAQWERKLESREALLFNPDRETYGKLSGEIDELRRRWESGFSGEAGETDPFAPGDLLDYAVLTPGEDSLLFDSPAAAQSADPDLILTGSVNRTGDFLIIEITRWESDGGESEPLWSGTGRLEDLEALAEKGADRLKTLLLGREWAALEVDVQPGNAQIFLNGRAMGVGKLSRDDLPPGPLDLEIRLAGHRTFWQTLDLLPGERLVRTVTLTPGEEKVIRLSTRPEGARVILGSAYLGKTPLLVNRPETPTALTLTWQGLEPINTVLTPKGPEEEEFLFRRPEGDWEEKRLEAKDKFYNSLGAFVISLGAPIVLKSLADNQRDLASRYLSAYDLNPTDRNADLYNKAFDGYYYSTGAFWGSLGVSGVFLGVSITRMVKYIRASESSIKQKE